MATGVSSLHSFEVSTTIKAPYYPVLLPYLLHGYESCMVPFPSKSSKGSSISTNSVINSGDPYPLQVSGDLDPLCLGTVETPSSSVSVFGRAWRCRASRWCGGSSWGLQRELSSSPTGGDGVMVVTRTTTQAMAWGRRSFPIDSRCSPQRIRAGGCGLTRGDIEVETSYWCSG
ncbi:unnamed protein product [Miscanthus lutarioriparius]|uniref:Uncharacterized protein n=1 Tax=Miscanthus lutarioriparius TaxID=422564 RepID=A0A811P846_9POAL|nr:unnamed protein product [Miscanthus lutarioriparius]